MSTVEQFLTAAQESEIITAIRRAEKQTSGEIRVHLEARHGGDIKKRAAYLFHELKMDNTREANGILLYIAVQDRAFYLMGDAGINAVVPVTYWGEVKDVLQLRFRESEFTKGIIDAITEIGSRLAAHFPWQSNDVNELPDTISKG